MLRLFRGPNHVAKAVSAGFPLAYFHLENIRRSVGCCIHDSARLPMSWLHLTRQAYLARVPQLGKFFLEYWKAIQKQNESFVGCRYRMVYKIFGMHMFAWSRPGPVPSHAKPKTVRFAYKNSFYSPRNTTPVIPHSQTLIAPPSTTYGLPGPSPYSVSYPPQSSTTSMNYAGPVRAHPLLDVSAVTYDLMDHPSTIMTRRNYPLSTHTLREQATTPRLPFLTITSIHLPWIIKVYASNGSYVSLEDVLNSLHRTLRTNITSTEFNLLSTQNDQRRATRAYERRYRRHRSSKAYEEEKRGGMKRVDFLMEHTKFLGIFNNSYRPDEWQLSVA